MLGIEWKVNDKSPYIDQATQENISKCFHRASNKLKMLSMQFPSFMCRGHRKGNESGHIRGKTCFT